MDNTWKVFLYPNQLTPEVSNDFIAEISTTGNTVRNEDIVERIVAGRSELRPETILSILNQRDEIVRQAVQQGSSVQDGNVRISPRVAGIWIGSEAHFDPKQHKITCDMTLTSTMRSALTTVNVEVLGTKTSTAYIGIVTNAATGATDGIIAAGDDIIIEGDKIRILPEGEDGLGVFFVNDSGEEIPVERRLTENNPKKLIARVPDLGAGSYTLTVKTKFANGTVLLKQPRTITYDQVLTVE